MVERIDSAKKYSTRSWGSIASSLGWVLRHQFAVLMITIATACLSVYLFQQVPKGFFPQQDTGRIRARSRRRRIFPSTR